MNKGACAEVDEFEATIMSAHQPLGEFFERIAESLRSVVGKNSDEANTREAESVAVRS